MKRQIVELVKSGADNAQKLKQPFQAIISTVSASCAENLVHQEVLYITRE